MDSTAQLGPNAVSTIQAEMDRLETRARANKEWADRAGAVIIALSGISGVVLAIPDATLQASDIPHITLARQILPVLTATAYATLRYFKWGEKHRWYWYQRHRLSGLLFRIREGDSALAREFAQIVDTGESDYPAPLHASSDENSDKSARRQPRPPPSP